MWAFILALVSLAASSWFWCFLFDVGVITLNGNSYAFATIVSMVTITGIVMLCGVFFGMKIDERFE